jgi:NADPH:quinone reductase-like Zn-dependent oxidoreductase
VPDGVGWTEAGGFAETFTTAHDALFTQCGLTMGERVCIHGAAGGVGTSAVQLAAAAGARVTATVRNPEHHDAVAALGAEVVVDPADFVEAGPYDVILELVGAPNWPANLDAIAPWGRIVVIGVGAGANIEMNLFSLMAKRATLRGSTLRARPLEEKADAAQRMTSQVLPHLASGALTVPVADTFRMDEANEAYERFTAGGKLGKIVLTRP